MSHTRLVVRALVLTLAVAGCKSPAPQREPIRAEPPAFASAVGAVAQASPADADGGVEASEAKSFWIECAGPSRLDGAPGPPCLIRGRVRAFRQVELAPERESPVDYGGRRPSAVRALELRIEPDDAVPCRTPFDPGEKELRLPGVDPRDVDRSGPILVFGGARIAGALREGARLCGWTRFIRQPGLGYPSGWEGEIADGGGALLGASSIYFDRATSRWLARSWSFSREGLASRQRIDEGGAFVRHESVRIHHGGGNAVSTGGAEVIVQGRDGAFAVTATSDLTEGNVPIFVGHHDGFAFSAVRIEGPRE